MVAAWIRAETGVGPSIASGNQVCSGNWPDLPQAPSSSMMPIAAGTPLLALPPAPKCAKTPAKDVVPK